MCSLLNLFICLPRKSLTKVRAISVLYLVTLEKVFPKIGMSRKALPGCIIVGNYESLKLMYHLIIISMKN